MRPSGVPVALTCLAALLLTGSASAATYVIRPDGTGDYPTIQAALDAAVGGDTVELTDGVFAGAGNRDLDFHGKALTVRSQSDDPLACIVDASEPGGADHQGFRFHCGEDASALVQGITITGATATGVRCYEASPTLEHCVLRGNSNCSGGGALSCVDASPQVSRCTFADNADVGMGQGGAVMCGACSFAEFTGCTFVNNSGAQGGALYATFTTVHLHNCVIAFGQAGQAVFCDEAGYTYLQCSDIYGNSGGDWVDRIALQLGEVGNISEDPLFCDWIQGNYRLTEASPCAPFSPPNPECDLIGAWPVGCTNQVVGSGENARRGLVLELAAPNPFRQSTALRYEVPHDPAATGTHVRLAIYDTAGRCLRTLVEGHQSAGVHVANWNGRGDHGELASRGVYFARLDAGVTAEQVTLILLGH
jgi:predicted outer membrane repeat protein